MHSRSVLCMTGHYNFYYVCMYVQKEERDDRFREQQLQIQEQQLQLDKRREDRLAKKEQRQIKKDEEEKARKESVPGQLRYFGKMVEHLLPKMGDDPTEYPAYCESVEDNLKTTQVPKTSRQD